MVFCQSNANKGDTIMKPKIINFSLFVSVFFSNENTGHVIYSTDMCAVAEKKCNLISVELLYRYVKL